MVQHYRSLYQSVRMPSPVCQGRCRARMRTVSNFRSWRIFRALAANRPVEGGSAARNEPALTRDRQPRMCGVDQLAPPADSHRREAFREKSRSTVSSPSWHATGRTAHRGRRPPPQPCPKHAGHALDRLPHPAVDQRLVHAVLHNDLSDRQLTLQRLERQPYCRYSASKRRAS